MKALTKYIQEAKMSLDEFIEIIKKCLESLGYELTDDEREIGSSGNVPRYFIRDNEISVNDGHDNVYIIRLDKKLTIASVDDVKFRENEIVSCDASQVNKFIDEISKTLKIKK